MNLYGFYAVDEAKARDGTWVKLEFGGKVKVRRQSEPAVTAAIVGIQAELASEREPDVFGVAATEDMRKRALAELCARAIVVDWDDQHTGPDGEPMECTPDAVRQVATDIQEWMLEILSHSNRREHFRPDSGNSPASRLGKRNGQGAKPISVSSKGAVEKVSAAAL